MKLNQVIALVAGKKARANRVLTDAHQGWRESMIEGIIRNYEPLNEDGERFPSESKPVQQRVSRMIPKIVNELVDYYDCVLTQEKGNQKASADIVINSVCVMPDVPITVILFLEKQVTDLLTFIKNLPVLPSDKIWTYDKTKDCYITEPETTTKTKKVLKALVKFPATKEHPAQTETYPSDETIGHWNTIKLSGAVTAEEKEKVTNRLEKLQDALKVAREQANSQEVTMEKMGEDIFKYIFAD